MREVSERAAMVAERLRGRQLRLIAAIGEQGTLRRASAAINVTQPTATKMLSEMESLLGVELYERSPRGLTATPYGQELLAFAVRLASEFERLIGTIDARRSGGVGELVVGAILGTTADVIAEAVTKIKERHPRLTIKLRGETSDNVLLMLERRVVDLVVGRFSPNQLGGPFLYEPLGEEALCLAARAGHPLSMKHDLTLSDTSDHRWVMHSMSNPARQIIEMEFAKAGVAPPRDVIEADSVLTVFRILEHSDAIAFLSEALAQDQVRVGQLCKLPVKFDAKLSSFGLVTRLGDSLQGVAAEFASCIREANMSG